MGEGKQYFPEVHRAANRLLFPSSLSAKCAPNSWNTQLTCRKEKSKFYKQTNIIHKTEFKNCNHSIGYFNLFEILFSRELYEMEELFVADWDLKLEKQQNNVCKKWNSICINIIRATLNFHWWSSTLVEYWKKVVNTLKRDEKRMRRESG